MVASASGPLGNLSHQGILRASSSACASAPREHAFETLSAFEPLARGWVSVGPETGLTVGVPSFFGSARPRFPQLPPHTIIPSDPAAPGYTTRTLDSHPFRKQHAPQALKSRKWWVLAPGPQVHKGGSDCTWRDPYLAVDLTLHSGGAALIPDPSVRVASSNAPRVCA